MDFELLFWKTITLLHQPSFLYSFFGYSIARSIVILDSELKVEDTIAIKPDYDSYSWYPSSTNLYSGWMKWHNNFFGADISLCGIALTMPQLVLHLKKWFTIHRPCCVGMA